MTDRRQVGRLLRGRFDLRAVTPRLTIGAVLLFWVAVGLVGCILTGCTAPAWRLVVYAGDLPSADAEPVGPAYADRAACEAAGVAHVARPDTPARHACLERAR